MSHQLHLFDCPTPAVTPAGWDGATVVCHPESAPDRQWLAQLFAQSAETVTLARGAGPHPLPDSSSLTVSVTRPAAAIPFAGGAELSLPLWQKYPRVAACLSESLLDWGVVSIPPGHFSPETLRTLPNRGDAALALIFSVKSNAIEWRITGDSTEHGPPMPQLLRPHTAAVAAWPTLANAAIAPLFPPSADASAVVAGLLLWHDLLDESHHVSQSIEGQGTHNAGDYWHAIMHRREGDYGNSKYWFRRVGRHPIFPNLADWANRLAAEARLGWGAEGDFNPTAFVDVCSAAEQREDSASGLLCRRIQAAEMLLLLAQTCDDAAG